MNAGNLALDNIEHFGEYPVLHWRGGTISNLELDARARRLASVLRDRGVVAGDRVAVAMPNCPDVFEAFQAVWKIGAVILPIRPQLAAPEIEHMLRNSEARAVITVGELVPLIERACPELRLVLATGDRAGSKAIHLPSETAGAEPLAGMTDRSGDDLALLLYTSGTTGKPKGVMLSHESVVSIPHPRMLTYMLEFPDRDRYDTSSLKSVWTGGAPLPEPVRRDFERVFSCRIRDGYGMTESGGAGAAYYDEDVFRPGSVGRAQPDTSIRVVDENGGDIRAGEQDLRRHVATHVTRFKIPERIVLLDEIPKNATGKLQKRAVRDRLLAKEGPA